MSLSPVERFSDRASYYTSHRPGYPEAIADLLIREARLDSEWTIADIGSGTGISTGLFARRGFRIYGVEPNASMRAEAELRMAGLANFIGVSGRAEATGLPDRAVNLVVAGTAFHWFDEAATRAEFIRILAPGGIAGIFWNRRMDGAAASDNCPFSRDYDQLLHAYTDYPTASHRGDRSQKTLAPFFGAEPMEAHFPNQQRLEFEGLVGRVLSASYAPLPGSPRYEPLLRALRELFDKYQRDEMVTMRYDACVYYGPLV